MEVNTRVSKEFIERLKESGLKPILPETNKATICVQDKAIPDKIGFFIGKYVNGVYYSNIENDENGELLQKYLEFNLLETRIFRQRINNELCEVPHFFFMYNVDESSVNRPTFTEESCGYATPMTGYYECEYEILLGSENYTRRMVFKTNSVNISMYEWLKDLESTLEDIEYADENIKSQFYKSEYDDCWCFTMYDHVGLSNEMELNVCEFLSMIVEIRQLSCKFIENNKSNI